LTIVFYFFCQNKYKRERLDFGNEIQPIFFLFFKMFTGQQESGLIPFVAV